MYKRVTLENVFRTKQISPNKIFLEDIYASNSFENIFTIEKKILIKHDVTFCILDIILIRKKWELIILVPFSDNSMRRHKIFIKQKDINTKTMLMLQNVFKHNIDVIHGCKLIKNFSQYLLVISTECACDFNK